MKKNLPPSEREFLLEKAAQAKLAIKEAASALQDNLEKGLSLEHWVKQHPWPSLGLGAVAGFAAGCLVVPDKEEPSRPRSEAEAPKPETTHQESKERPLKMALSSGLSALALDISRELLHQWFGKNPVFSGRTEQDPDAGSVPSPS